MHTSRVWAVPKSFSHESQSALRRCLLSTLFTAFLYYALTNFLVSGILIEMTLVNSRALSQLSILFSFAFT